MARNFYRIFTENNPVMEDSKTFGIPEAKGLRSAIALVLLSAPNIFQGEQNTALLNNFVSVLTLFC